MLVVLAPVFVAQLVTFKCDIADSAKCLQASPLLLLGNETNGADATVWPHGSELLGDLSPSPPPPPRPRPHRDPARAIDQALLRVDHRYGMAYVRRSTKDVRKWLWHSSNVFFKNTALIA